MLFRISPLFFDFFILHGFLAVSIRTFFSLHLVHQNIAKSSSFVWSNYAPCKGNLPDISIPTGVDQQLMTLKFSPTDSSFRIPPSLPNCLSARCHLSPPSILPRFTLSQPGHMYLHALVLSTILIADKLAFGKRVPLYPTLKN